MKKMRRVLNEILTDDLSPGEFIRGRRVELGLSQDELAEITRIARSNISAIENGRMDVTAHYALIFAAAFNLHPQEILFPNGKFTKGPEFEDVAGRA
jgi:transcriptional regulator with XRE-family HTH domain